MDKHTNAKGFPTAHVLGFAGSLIMTFVAGIVALKTSLSFDAIMWIIGSLAILQAGMQLFMFMHVTEGEKNTQLINIIYGVFMAVVIVAGTIWVMSFGLHSH